MLKWEKQMVNQLLCAATSIGLRYAWLFSSDMSFIPNKIVDMTGHFQQKCGHDHLKTGQLQQKTSFWKFFSSDAVTDLLCGVQ